MRSTITILILALLLPSAVQAVSTQKETSEALCAVLEKLYGKGISLEKPFALFYGIGDWNEDASGKTRGLPSATLTVGLECEPEKHSAKVTLTSSSAVEKVIENKVSLNGFYGSVQKQLFTVDDQGEITADITFITTVNTKDLPVPPSTYKYDVEIDPGQATLVTAVVVDDLKTKNKSCYDDSVSPTVKVACRASQKITLRRETDKTIAHTDKSAQFYDAQWKLLPNTGWKIGPEKVATSDWKEVQAAYQLRTAP